MATDTDKDTKDNKEELPNLDRDNPPEGYEKSAPGGDKGEPKSKKAAKE